MNHRAAASPAVRPVPRNAERLAGIVERVTFHDAASGWCVVRLAPFGAPHTRVTVTLHHVAVFAGASMELWGRWTNHPRYGEQFDCSHARETKPASVAALQRYLGSGLIRGVGPKTARKIVRAFGEATLEVLDADIERLAEVRGIGPGKLASIAESWRRHRAIRDVTMFLQEHGVSTLFAVRIYLRYGDRAIATVRDDPYRLARDIYGIGFFSADRIARSLGFALDGLPRIESGVRHVLAASREEGHCFLLREQVRERALVLLAKIEARPAGDGASRDDARPENAATAARLGELIDHTLATLAARGDVKVRELLPEALPGAARRATAAAAGTTVHGSAAEPGAIDAFRAGASATARRAGAPASAAAEPTGVAPVLCYYARSLYQAEDSVARQVARRIAAPAAAVDKRRVDRWLDAYGAATGFVLSAEQRAAVRGMAAAQLAVLTGGPGCGKTTTLRALVRLLRAMGRRTTLAAPTGRAAQRMNEVTGMEAATLHRLLEWDAARNGFRRDRDNPLDTDIVIVDEASMLDVLLAAALLAATPAGAGVLLIGDPHQLPSVGPGDLLADLLRAPAVPRFALTQVFRQQAASAIVRCAHAINAGQVPELPSPIAAPRAWADGATDCFLLDAEQATTKELRFLRRARGLLAAIGADGRERALVSEGRTVGSLRATAGGIVRAETASPDAVETFSIPRRLLRVNLEQLARSDDDLSELRTVLRRIHPHSVLRHGLSLTGALLRLYTRSIPRLLGAGVEVQVLSPMNRGSAGATALNRALQQAVNPPASGLAQLELGGRILRAGDRVIQRRNDYDLGVFNGDIGIITAIDEDDMTASVEFARGAAGSHRVTYTREALAALALAYAITVHKAQGSEFAAVIIPLVTQHYGMLFRDLVYTALTRARRLAVFVGSREALALAVRNAATRQRQTALAALLGGQR